MSQVVASGGGYGPPLTTSNTYYGTGDSWWYPSNPYYTQPRQNVTTWVSYPVGLTEAQARDLIREELARLFPDEAAEADAREACPKCGRKES